MGENNELKNRIIQMRTEIKYAKGSIEAMEEEIQKLKDDSRLVSKEGFNYDRQTSETNNQILALKCKHEEGKETFETDIKRLQEQLKEKDENVDITDKGLNINREQKSNKRSNNFANPLDLLQIRLDNIINKNHEKKRLLD